MTRTSRGKQIVIDSLTAEGVRHVFGNPGTTELPFLDALADNGHIDYVLCLQEAAALSMADAYAHASDTVGVVNLHVAPGLGNAIGSLYNASEGNTPLLVTAGQQDSRLRLREPLLSHDLVAMAAPLVKWSVEARHADELALIMHRAFRTAREAPAGPVFVSLPMDVMDQATRNEAIAPSRLHLRAEPDVDGVADAVRLLLRAENPFIVCGDRVASGGAVIELVALAELLGAPVWSEVLPARLNFPLQHDLCGHRMPQDHAAIARVLEGADVVLLVGGDFFEEVWFAEEAPFPPRARLIHVDETPQQVARFQRSDCGIAADVRASLRAIAHVLARRASEDFKTAATARRAAHAATRTAQHTAWLAGIEASGMSVPMSSAVLMHEVAAALPADAAVVAEPITAGADMLRALDLDDPQRFLAARGGGIGQGLPSAIGFKLAHPGRPVLCLSGDGSALYNVQALWSAAHHRVPVVFVVIDNGAYRILKRNMDRYRRGAGIGVNRAYPHLDLVDPAPDWISLARGFGVMAQRVEDPAHLRAALKAAFESGEPRLLDVVVDGRLA